MMSSKLFGNHSFNAAFIASLPVCALGLYMVMRDDVPWALRGVVAVLLSAVTAIMTLSGYMTLQRQRANGGDGDGDGERTSASSAH